MSDSDQYTYEWFCRSPLVPPELIAKARRRVNALLEPCPFFRYDDPIHAENPWTLGDIDAIICSEFGPIVAAQVRPSVH
jgi:hypothetical protein